MASIKELKKQINYSIGDIIGECLMFKAKDPKSNTEKSEVIVDEAISKFDALIEKVNTKNVENTKAHFKSINEELQANIKTLQEKIEAL